ncbi:MAG TPA: hypothetical protein VFC19_05920 [Candidatus Limnocylindrales bacterium]|nr:hypothetical protein [Candidatus Limnocylindrales bacterium]
MTEPNARNAFDRWGWLLVLPFAAAGWAIVSSTADRGTSAWSLWAAIVVALTASAGGACVYGVKRWRELAQTVKAETRFADVVGPIVFFVGVSAFIGAAYEVVFLPVVKRVEWRGGLILVVVFLGIVPILATMAAIGKHAARPVTQPWAEEFDRLIRCRRMTQRLLVVLGGLVALLVAAQASAYARYERPSTLLTVGFGVYASVMVAVAYAPAAERLRRKGLSLIDVWLPLPPEPGELLDAAEKRARAEALLGTDKSVFGDLQTNLVVVTPLIAAAVSALLPA